MPTIHFLLSQWDDYLSEYSSFFIRNYQKFSCAQTGLPQIVAGSRKKPFPGFSQLVKLCESGQLKHDKRMTEELLGKERIALLAPVMGAIKLPRFMEYLVSLSNEWKNARTHFLWLAAPRSHEIEGAYRRNPVEQTRDILTAQVEEDPSKWLKALETALGLADSLAVLASTKFSSFSGEQLLKGMALGLEGDDFEPVSDQRLKDRELAWLAQRLGLLAPMESAILTAKLKAHDSPIIKPFMNPGILQGYDDLYNESMLELAARYGSPITFRDAARISGEWKPFAESNAAQLKTKLEMIFGEGATVDASLAKRIFSVSWPRAFPEYKDLRTAAGPEPLLSVLTLACNQRDFIAQCLDSVIDQKTGFPVRHIVLDDGSTDGTDRIIFEYARKYPHIVPIFLKKPHAPGENVRLLFDACRSTYAALCDGDDYFSDPYKLQKQADFLDNHPECSLCFHPVDIVYEDGRPSRVYPEPDMLTRAPGEHYTLRDLISNNLIQTNSVVYRWRFRNGLPDWFRTRLLPGDRYWHLLHAENGLIGFLPEHMSVYRRHAASIYASAEQDHVRHRLKHGIRELEVYETLDRHFKRRFHKDFSTLADGIFADLTTYFIEQGDEGPLMAACEASPLFGHEYLGKLNLN